MTLRYRLHRLKGQLERRCYEVSCLSNSGIALGPFNRGGDDLGVAVWTAPYKGGTSNAVQFFSAPSVSVFAVNDSGQFVGHQLRGDTEKAVVGAIAEGGRPPSTPEKTTPLDSNIQRWSRVSAAYGINSGGDFVGFRKKDTLVAYVCSSAGEITDLDLPEDAPDGCYAIAINDHGVVVGAALGKSNVLLWTKTGTLVSSRAADFGTPLRVNNAGQVLCSYGIIDGGNEFWIPSAPRCLDFDATDMNNRGHAVGSGRPIRSNELISACLWGPNSTCWNLNDLIDDRSVHLGRATAINDAGWIAADSYLLEPIGER